MDSLPAAELPYLHLSCPVQCYAWGKVGGESQVAQLKCSAEPDNFVVDEKQTYAEVWALCLCCGFGDGCVRFVLCVCVVVKKLVQSNWNIPYQYTM